jgi:AcrR family transcriptional regulator
MPRPAQLSKNQLAQSIIPIFQNFGYEGATLSKLSSATNLSKASLYHHYPKGKEDMGRHALAYTGTRLQRLILNPLKQENARKAIMTSTDGIVKFYNDPIPVCLMNSLTVGEGKDLFGAEIRATVDIWITLLATVFSKLGLPDKHAIDQARSLIQSIQGCLIICRLEESAHPLHQTIERIKNSMIKD